MRALVVYESMFGNTQLIAKSIGEGLATCIDTEVVEVGSAPQVLDEGVSLLVVGGPTHAFSMTKPATRKSAAEQATGALVSTGIGIREWLDALGGTAEVGAAAFDTRVDKPRLPGSAARGADKRLRSNGFHRVAGPTSFYVHGTTGPVVDGELDRARRWGETLGAKVSGASQRV